MMRHPTDADIAQYGSRTLAWLTQEGAEERAQEVEAEEDAESADPSLEDHFPGLYLTLKNRPAILEDTSGVSYHGRIRPNATECVVSFPGKFASGWDALIEERYEQSVACVFLCRPEDGLGKHSINPEAPPEASVRCYCPTIYGERNFKQFGYLDWLPDGCSIDKEKQAREKAKYTNAVVVRANADEKERLEAERQAEEAWKKSGKTASWGCRWFEVWKEKVHEAVAKGQTLKVVYFPGQLGQGHVAWNELSQPYVDLWDGVGCGGSQKGEIAYLNMMRKKSPGKGWEYDGVDVINYLKKAFKPQTMVLARDGHQWHKGIMKSYPMLAEQQSMNPRKMEWTTLCHVQCLETEKEFYSECLRPAHEPDGIWCLLDTVGKDYFSKILTENLPEGTELGEDAEFIFPDGTPSLRFRMKVTSVKAMQKLRGKILSNDFEIAINKELLSKQHGRWQVQVDKTFFCAHYEKKLLRFSKATEHQKKILKQMKVHFASESNVHISAVAGAGKTFIAVRLVMDTLLNNSDGLILYVAPCKSLCLFFIHWVARRVQGRSSLRDKFSIQFVLDRIRVMPSPYKELMRLHVAGNRLEFQSISHIGVVGQTFLLTVLDEAHDIYRDGVDHAFLKDLQSERSILLSNLSQSSALQESFPDMPIVKLTEVVRNTKRIIAGAAAFFAAALEREGITSLGVDGPPLKTFFFVAQDSEDVMKAYIRHTLYAIRHLLRTYMGLRLHSRLALIVPDNKFLLDFKPRLEAALEDQPFRSQLRFESFEESLSLLPADLLPTDQEVLSRDMVDTIVLDKMENCKGLEHLMVLCIGLDAPIHLEADAMVTRAHIYQALTRAQLHAIVINEYVQKGWLEFLGLVKFTELEMFEESRALAETEANAAANTLVELQHPVPEPELPATEAQESRTSVKQESAAATQPESKHEAIPAIQATQATQATQASRSQPEALLNASRRSQDASRPSQDVPRPSQADVQGGFVPERKVAVMATSVWDTGDNDDRIAERIKELLFDPRQKQKAGCRVFCDQASAGKVNFAAARSKPFPALSHTAQTLSKFSCNRFTLGIESFHTFPIVLQEFGLQLLLSYQSDELAKMTPNLHITSPL
eukprot:symbB.v1.2.018312.t1/scaffold1456.1/size117650/2